LAKSIGFSKAYIYKFFDSKQAIGEAICAKTLRGIVATVEEAVAGATTPTEKFRRMFKILVTTNVSLFFNDRKLYDVAAYAAGEQWPSARAYCERLRQIVSEIVREGAGERRVRAQDPARRDGACDRSRHAALCESAPPPVHLDVAEEAPVQLSNLVLRSLAT
jgi:AcrR family transcriptional regulator